MPTMKMKLVGAIVVGGEVVRPPAIVEVSEAEAANLAHRGKAVPATEHDSPTATSPSAEVAKGDNPLDGASAANPIDATVDVGGQSVAVQIVGQDADGTPVVTDTSADAIEAAALREAANAAAAAVTAAEAEAANVDGKTRAQKKADSDAVEAAKAAAAEAEAAALAAEAKLTPAT